MVLIAVRLVCQVLGFAIKSNKNGDSVSSGCYTGRELEPGAREIAQWVEHMCEALSLIPAMHDPEAIGLDILFVWGRYT